MRAAVAAAFIAFAVPGLANAQSVRPDASGDVSVGYVHILDSAKIHFDGFKFSAAKNLSETWAVVAEADWLAGDEPYSAFSGGSGGSGGSGSRVFEYRQTAVLAGARFRRFDGTSSTPYFQALVGRVSRNTSDSLLTGSSSRSSVALRTEVGIDWQFARRTALRAGIGFTFLSADVRYTNQLNATVGLSWAFGKR